MRAAPRCSAWKRGQAIPAGEAMTLARSRHASSGFDRRRRGKENGVRLGIVAILAAFLIPPGARAKSNCANWNSWSFFETAGAEDVRACLRAGTDPTGRGWLDLAARCRVQGPCRRDRGAARGRGRSRRADRGWLDPVRSHPGGFAADRCAHSSAVERRQPGLTGKSCAFRFESRRPGPPRPQ